MNYKDTLLMPKTNFEMKGKLPTKEPKIQAKWEEIDLFELLLEERKNNKAFVLHDGPPYANGDIHIGHGLNKVLKDFVNRTKSIQGYYTPYIPGWDTHGLPIETAITKTGVNRKKMSVAQFRDLCEKYAYEQIEKQKIGFKRLGSIGDYKNPYITMTKDYEAEQIRIFGNMALKGLIYQDYKPVYWSPSSETALAEGELEYYDKEDTSVYVKFNVIDGKGLLDNDTSLMCWTTMPWTITTVVGVSVGKDFEYGVYETNKGKLLFAKELADDIVNKTGLEVKLVKSFKGSELEYLKVVNPYFKDKEALVVLGDHVTVSDGTGCVTTSPAHGTEDFYVAKEYDLVVEASCDKYGKMLPELGEELAGVYWEKANQIIIDKMDVLDTLVSANKIVHSYPYDWRTKKPIIFMAALQWFASIEKVRDDILHQIDNVVKWTPSWGKTRMHNMISDRGDWCISRQRAWGVPIPIIFDENNNPLMDREVFEFVAQKFNEYGSNYWFDSEVKDLLPKKYLDNPKLDQFRKETDIMDVWFDSGSSHTGAIKARGMEYPVDMYLEGSDQYRGWFNSSLIVGTCVYNQSPYREVLSHGFTLDGNGNKMSKSLGNTMEPLKIIDTYGADVFRYWVASVDYQADVRISDNMLKQVADTYRKVRNTYKFILGNLNDFNDTMLIDVNDLEEVDKYLLIKLNNLNTKVINAYNAYEYSVAYNSINSFIVKELSAFYMDFTKDILYILKENDLRRRQVQTVLYHCIDVLNMLLAPILCHTSEEVYSYIPKTNKKKSVHLEVVAKPLVINDSDLIEAKYDKFMLHRNDVLKAIEIAREAKVIGKSLEAKVVITLKEGYEFIADLDNLKQLYIVSSVEISNDNSASEFDSAYISVSKYEGLTCPRCWNVVKEDELVDGLCTRCHDVLNK